MSNKHFAPQLKGAFAKIDVLAANVVLGNPRFMDCSQHGICHIDPVNADFKPCGCPNQAMAWVRRTASGRLCLSFMEAILRPEILDGFFENDLFLIENTFSPSDLLCSLLQLEKDQARIEPGAYLITRRGAWLEVSFDQIVPL
jgi:hypothetical protein